MRRGPAHERPESGRARLRGLALRLRVELGQAATEYLGVLVLIAVIVGVIAAARFDLQIAAGIERQICVVLGDGPCEDGEAADGEGDAGSPGAGPPLSEEEVESLGPGAEVPEGQAEGVGGGSHAVDPSGTQSDPVNSLTGAFESQVTDAQLPAPGLAFAFTRSYSSAHADDEEPGPLGPGWTHSYATRLEISPGAREVELVAGDGQRISYTLAEDSYVAASEGVRSALRRVRGGLLLTTHDRLQLRFDGGGRLRELRDENGNATELRYNDGVLGEIEDASGAVTTLTHDDSGRLTEVALPDGRTTAYAYDDDGRLETFTDLRGGTVAYDYDDDDRLTEITDQRGSALVENEYSDDGRVEQQTDALGEQSTFEWNEDTRTSTMTDARGNEWSDTYRNNALVAREDPLGNSTYYRYEGDLNVAEVVDPRGHSTTYTYDGRGNVTRIEAPEPFSYVTKLAWSADNEPLRVTDPAGESKRLAYDADGNLVRVEDRSGAVTTLRPDPRTGLTRSVTDPLGRTTRIAYGDRAKPTAVVLPSGRTTRYRYDEAGRLLALTEPGGLAGGADAADFTYSFVYNQNDQLVAATDPLGSTATLGYDAVGNVVSATDAKDRSATYAYDEKSQLQSVDPPGETRATMYAYDAVGNLTEQTDPLGRSWSFAYDAADRPIEAHGPSGERYTASYDAAGNVVSAVSARGTRSDEQGDYTTTLAYDALGRPTAVDYSDETPDLGFEYDENSNLTDLHDGLGTERYSYDAEDRLTAVVRGGRGSPAGGRAFSYAYDPAGQLTERIYPDGTRTTYSYDRDGRLASADAPGGQTRYGYDPAGRLVETLLPNGASERRSFDRAGRLTEIRSVARSGDPIAFARYALDATGNPTSKVTDTGTETYSYDDRDRLTAVCQARQCEQGADALTTFAYDGVGNRTAVTSGGATTTYAYDDSDHLEQVVAPDGAETDYTHDADGNLVAAGEQSFSYDLAGRMTSAEGPEGSASYTYDGSGNRVRSQSDAGATRFEWDKGFGLPQIATERSGSGELLRRYSYGVGRISQEVPGGDRSYYHSDALGSTIALSGRDGERTARASYSAFGKLRDSAAAPGADAANANRIGFTGERADATGLYNLRARQYDPTTARFTQADPVSPGVGMPARSAYAYVGNRPTVFTDPSGMVFGVDVTPEFVDDAAKSVDDALVDPVGNEIGGFASDRAEDIATGAKAFDDAVIDPVGSFVSGIDPIAVVEVITDVSGVVSLGASAVAAGAAICSATVVAAPACGPVAAGAAGVAAVSGGISAAGSVALTVEDCAREGFGSRKCLASGTSNAVSLGPLRGLKRVLGDRAFDDASRKLNEYLVNAYDFTQGQIAKILGEGGGEGSTPPGVTPSK